MSQKTGKADEWKDPKDPNSEWKNEDENGNKQWDTDGDGKPDARDTNKDGNADEWLNPKTNEWESGDSKNPKPEDTNKDGLPDRWVDEQGREVAKDTSVPPDGKADEFKDPDGEYPQEDKYPKGKDTDGDGLPDVWVDENGNIVAKDTSDPRDRKSRRIRRP